MSNQTRVARTRSALAERQPLRVCMARKTAAQCQCSARRWLEKEFNHSYCCPFVVKKRPASNLWCMRGTKRCCRRVRSTTSQLSSKSSRRSRGVSANTERSMRLSVSRSRSSCHGQRRKVASKKCGTSSTNCSVNAKRRSSTQRHPSKRVPDKKCCCRVRSTTSQLSSKCSRHSLDVMPSSSTNTGRLSVDTSRSSCHGPRRKMASKTCGASWENGSVNARRRSSRYRQPPRIAPDEKLSKQQAATLRVSPSGNTLMSPTPITLSLKDTSPLQKCFPGTYVKPSRRIIQERSLGTNRSEYNHQYSRGTGIDSKRLEVKPSPVSRPIYQSGNCRRHRDVDSQSGNVDFQDGHSYTVTFDRCEKCGHVESRPTSRRMPDTTRRLNSHPVKNTARPGRNCFQIELKFV